jgi:hypothetical protein
MVMMVSTAQQGLSLVTAVAGEWGANTLQEGEQVMVHVLPHTSLKLRTVLSRYTSGERPALWACDTTKGFTGFLLDPAAPGQRLLVITGCWLHAQCYVQQLLQLRPEALFSVMQSLLDVRGLTRVRVARDCPLHVARDSPLPASPFLLALS